MIWRTRSENRDKHSFLSPSKAYWVNYDDDKLRESYSTHSKAVLGTRYHALAEECIRLGIRLPNNTATINAFVNDAIGFRMQPEQLLYYSENCFGTADAISYHDGHLRIHDLKTGSTPGHPLQLEIYAAIFFLDYGEQVGATDMTLRIYQNDEVLEWKPSPSEIVRIMDTIINHDRIIKEMQANV